MRDVMLEVLRIAAGISTMWSIAAFTIALIFYLAIRKTRPNPFAWGALVAMVVLGLVPIIGTMYADRMKVLGQYQAVYEVRVSVREMAGNASISNATVHSSVGIDPAFIDSVWEFKIPSALKPADGKIEFLADVPSEFERGSATVVLGDDFHPVTTISVEPYPDAIVRGNIFDENRKALNGASVRVAGYKDTTISADGGAFELPAHAPAGTEVELLVEKPGYIPVNQGHPAGRFPATVVLYPAKKTRLTSH